MKVDTIILVGAGAIAAALVFMPKRAAAQASSSSGPLTGRGDGATVWNPQAQALYREQLGRDLASAGDFWV